MSKFKKGEYVFTHNSDDSIQCLGIVNYWDSTVLAYNITIIKILCGSYLPKVLPNRGWWSPYYVTRASTNELNNIGDIL